MHHFLFLVGLALAVLGGSAAYAEPPEAFRYHGTILTLQGAPVADGAYTFEVRIYDSAAPGSGTLLFDTQVGATVESGAYSILVSPGPGQEGTLRDVFEAGPRFVEVEVLAGPEGPINETLQPRQEITAVPYALNAGSTAQARVFTDSGSGGFGVQASVVVPVPDDGRTWAIEVHGKAIGRASQYISKAFLVRIEQSIDGDTFTEVDRCRQYDTATNPSNPASLSCTVMYLLPDADPASEYTFELHAVNQKNIQSTSWSKLIAKLYPVDASP